MRRLSLVLAILLAAPVSASAGESWYSVYRPDHRNWTVAVSGGASFMGLEGDTTIDDSLGDTSVSLDGVLDLTELTTFWVEADVQLFRGKHFRAGYTPLSFDGSDSLASAITVDGTTYDPGDIVDSELNLDMYELSVLWDFYLTEFVTVSPLIQVSLIDAEIDISNDTQLVSVTEDQLLPIPYIGVKGEVYPLSRLSLFAEGKGMTLGSLATTWEVQGGMTVHLTKNVALQGKYRYLDYSFDFSDTELDLNLGGAYVGTTVRF